MFQFRFKGAPDATARFKTLIERHAAWLSMRVTSVPSHPDWLALRLLPSNGNDAATACGKIRFDCDDAGELTVTVPAVTPEQAYVVDNADGVAIGDDLRPLWLWAGGTWDREGAALQLLFGMVPTPLTIAKDVRRIGSGYRYRHRESGRLERHAATVEERRRPIADDQVDALTESRLDETLAATPQQAVVFFSGGTDSTWLAARLAAAGRHDIQLVNYAFGDHDDESAYAEKLAGQLGLRFERVQHRDDAWQPVCDQFALNNPFPYDDLSTIPTQAMISASAEPLQQGSAALLGVGADDLYDGGLKIRDWEGLAAKPRWARRFGVSALGLLSPWLRNDRWRRVWGITRRSLLTARAYGGAIMHNDLFDLVYRHDDLGALAMRCWDEAYEPFIVGSAAEDRMAWIYLQNGGMGWEAPKFESLRRLGVTAHFPFLDGAMLDHGLSLSWQQKCADQKDKVLLKRLLDRALPQAAERRPKVGFSPPFDQMLADDLFQQRIRAALLDDDAPLAGLYDADRIAQLLDRGARGDKPTRGTINLLWTAFVWALWAQHVRVGLEAG